MNLKELIAKQQAIVDKAKAECRAINVGGRKKNFQ